MIWNETDFVWQGMAIFLLSLATLICCSIVVSNIYHYYRNGKKMESKSFSIQIILVCISTILLIILSNSLSKESEHNYIRVQSILSKYWNDRENNSHFWDNLQSVYKCCGMNDYSDWGFIIPNSCYQTQTTWLIWKEIITCGFAHENGCVSVMANYLDEMIALFKLIALCFVSLGIFAIVGILVTGLICLVFRKTIIF